MKKLFLSLLLAALMGLTACGGDAGSSAPESSSQPESSSEVSSEVATPKPTEEPTPESTPTPTPKPTPTPTLEPELALGETYATDTYEVTVNNVSFMNKCTVQLSANSSTFYEASEGNTLLCLETSIKNIDTDTLNTWSDDLFSAKALYSGKYNYAGTRFVGENDITPLSTKTECLVVEVPKEVASSEEHLEIFVTVGTETYKYTVR